jgi:hypothetical protein
MSTVTLTTRGPFSLAQTRAFLEGWPPADARLSGGALRLAFALDDGEHAAAALVTQDGDAVRAELQTDGDHRAAAAQLARMLSLDVDATAWPEAGRRDPLLGELQGPAGAQAEQRPDGCTPVRRSGSSTSTGSRACRRPSFRVVAHWPTRPSTDVWTPPTCVPWTLRQRASSCWSCPGPVDVLPSEPEPRLARALQDVYDLDAPADAARLQAIAEPWRPFRTWGCVLVRASAADA